MKWATRVSSWSFLLVLLLVSCKQPGFYQALGDSVSIAPLAIAPVTITVVAGGSTTFTASGGAAPYAFSVVSGPGSIDSAKGIFTATTAGTTVVRVTDKNGSTKDATVTVTAAPVAPTPPVVPVAIGPSTATVGTGGSITFVGSGGTPPYTFSLGTNTSGASINATSGVYIAGTSTGTDAVIVKDSATPAAATKTATIAVTSSASTVDYSIPSTSALPTTAVGGEVIPGGSTFTIANGPAASGGQPITYWVYLSSSNTSPNSANTILLDSGTTAGLPANGSTGIVLSSYSGKWPLMPPAVASMYFWFQISSPDDLNASNNLAGPFPIAFTPAQVDYAPSSVAAAAPMVAGQPITGGSFVLTNVGVDPGTQPVHWIAYVGQTSGAVIDGTCTVVASGIQPALNPGAPNAVSIPFAGTWPTTAGIWFLKVKVSASDDINAANDISVSAVDNVTQVDYANAMVSAVLGNLYANNAVTAQIQYQNVGTANGTQPVTWTLYVSPSPGLSAGATVVATGPGPSQVAGATAVGIAAPFTWPSTAGTWYLTVSVRASDDQITGDDVGPSVSYTITPPPADNSVISVTYGGGSIVPGGTVNGSFTYQNVSAYSESQPSVWRAYASITGVIDGTEQLVASGTAPALASGATSASIPFSGPWPLAYGSYFLLVDVSSPEDANTTNDSKNDGTPTLIGTTNAALFEPNEDTVGLSNAVNLGITLRPGMSYHVQGNLTSGDTGDVLAFNTGTANSITLYMTWGVSANMTIYFMSGPPGTFLTSGNVAAGTTLTMAWVPGAPNAARYIYVFDTLAQNIGTYDLIITAN